MKIISRYVAREHIGPFTFAFTALTSLMLLNYIAKQFGQLVGKGLPMSVIWEFFVLSLPLTVALTAPMSVLVAVLYAFSRLAAENEVTALKASGVSPWRIVAPALVGGFIMSLGLLAFNDQVLPRSNHELQTLQNDISQTKPTFLLKEQVINPVLEGKFYLKAGKIDRVGGGLKEVVIYDLGDPVRRRTIYADSGRIAMESNHVDLDLDLYHGQMQEVSTDKPGQLNRLYYQRDRIRIRDVGRDFKQTNSDSMSKGDREMGICEMQKRLWVADGAYAAAVNDASAAMKPHAVLSFAPKAPKTPEPRGLGWAYCKLLNLVPSVRTAQAAEVAVRKSPVASSAQATQVPATQAPSTRNPPSTTVQRKFPPLHGPALILPPQRQAGSAPAAQRAPSAGPVSSQTLQAAQTALSHEANDDAAPLRAEMKLRLQLAQRARDRYDLEINKKFSLAAACLIFCILAPPIALRFPRGGVGLVIGVSLAVFALYYVGLIGGEAAANNGLVRPFWAMWTMNLLMTFVGIVLLARMGKDSGSTRGGGIRDWLDDRRARREERRAEQLARTIA